VRNKILIVDANAEDREQLEQILQEIVEEGGELFFADKREDGLAILKKERPPLVFLDAPFVGEDKGVWEHEGVHLILMLQKSEARQTKEDFVLKPFKRHQVLEKCHAVLHKEPSAPIPPM
jgi:DNA-binding response OmpR family regulator